MRAHDHLQEIQRRVLEWQKSDANYSVTPDYNRGTRRYRVWVEINDRTALDPLPVLIGDYLHNVRSGLDHLALELAEAHTPTLNQKIIQDSEFPILGDEDGQGNPGKGAALFRKAAHKLAAVDPGAKATIERLQPYQRGAQFRSDVLWQLYDLARIDRHRLLHVTVAANVGVALDPNDHRNLRGFAPGGFDIAGADLEHRTKVFETIAVPINPKADVYVNVQPVIKVVFGRETPNVGGQPVIQPLGQIYEYVVNDVVLPLAKYL